MKQKAYIEIHLLSEAILGGAGEQKGTVDIDIQVDEYGLPYFAARTLKGVLRDRAAWFVRCLPEEKRPVYEQALMQLFGKADAGDEHHSNYDALRFAHAKLSYSLYEVIAEEKADMRETMKAITTIRSMTSIDEQTGTAKEGSLRQARMMHSGYTFVAPIFINRPLSEVEKELLTTSVKLLRHIGLMRNRGKGEVACTLHWGEMEQVDTDTKQADDKDPYIVLTIDVEEPLKINEVLRSSDSTRALKYIPGHVLRGALVHAYLQDALDTEHIFHPDRIQFWNGYLVVKGKRSLPFAQHLFETKADAKSDKKVKTVYNSLDEKEFAEIELQSPVRVNRHMMTLDEGTIIGADVETTSSLHININGPDGRRSDALMYRYEAIAPKQQFQAVIQVGENHDFVEWLKNKNDFYVWLGGARNSGYGRSRVTVQTGNENTEMPKQTGSFSEELYIMATSDWILYNEHGQLISAIDDEWLSEQLGATVQLVGQVVNTEWSGGYISHWRAYQPMVRAVKAGSIFRYRIVDGSIDEVKLQELIHRGVGSRTNEGFGRFIALPDWNYKKIQLEAEKATFESLEKRRLHNKEREQLESTLLKRAITSGRIQEIVFDEVNRWYDLTGADKLKQINTSQWSKLLQVTTDVLRAETDVRSVYKTKWETFWEDVKKRTENKSKLGYDTIKISVSEQKKSSIKDFILQDLYEKEWQFTKPNSDEAIYWSLEALQLFVRKVLRQV
mgnify:CR=1 FL=1